MFVVPDGSTLDPAEPWRLTLLVQRLLGARDKAFLTFDVGYTLPDHYLKIQAPAPAPAPERTAAPPPAMASPGTAALEDEEPLWHRMWIDKTAPIVILVLALIVVTAIFSFRNGWSNGRCSTTRLRTGFLVFTLLWIGWVAQAQLSVVNVLTFASALRSNFQWDYFLMAPLIFILWFAVAAGMLFWGRGAFCGWLCPFGALQELLNRAAKLVGIPQIKVPWGVHQRLVAVKYVVFLVLFGLSLGALATAEQAAEVEPFKTAIVLHFARGWPFVLYAGVVLAASLFVERFFCRYMCPLGAGLAIPARLRLFEWLRRYRECGHPCQQCATECPVQAIHPEGHINPNECIQCLHCQVLYYDDRRCPVMIQKRLRREKRREMMSGGIKAATAGAIAVPAKTNAAPS